MPSIRKTFPLAVVPGLPHCTATRKKKIIIVKSIYKNIVIKNLLTKS